MLHDLRYALRLFRRRPGVVALVVATLAIGIAAATIVFSLSDAILWHPLPFPHADRLVKIRAVVPPIPRGGVRPAIGDWTGQREILDAVHLYTNDAATVIVGDEPTEVTVCDISQGLLKTLGVAPAWGRDFVADDYRADVPPVVLSADLWRRLRASGAPATERTIRIDGVPHAIVGVMPPAFEFPVSRVALWRPYIAAARAADTIAGMPVNLTALGILKTGVTVAQAEAFAKTTSPRVLLGPNHLSVRITPFVTMSDTTVAALRALIGAVGVLFLIAVGNAGNVLLAEAVRRDGEMALRASLGASRARLARQVVTETLLLSGAAAVVALLVASWSLDLLVTGVPYIMSFQVLRPVRLDWRTLAFAASVTAAAGLATSYVSAFRAGRADLLAGLGGLKAGAAGRSRARGALTAAQIAATLILLAAAGLLGKGFLRLSRQDAGFDPERLVNVEFSVPEWRYPSATERQQLLDRMRELAARLPGVVDATVTASIPPHLGFETNEFLETDRGPVEGRYTVAFGSVNPGFFRTLGIPLVEGRPFDVHDAAGGLPVAVVSRALAEGLWPGADALGHRFRETETGPWMTVVGVAGNARNGGFEQPLGEAAFYTPRAQSAPWWFEGLVVRTRPAPDEVVPALRTIVRQTMPEAPIEDVQTGYETISGENSRVRFATCLTIGFAVVALALALVGVYGSFWCAVAQRRREIGVRVALGASPADVMRMVLGASARLTLIGLAIGLPLALAATRLLRSLLFEVSPNDPATFAAVAAFLAAAAMAATYLPARRAASIDPAEALRRE